MDPELLELRARQLPATAFGFPDLPALPVSPAAAQPAAPMNPTGRSLYPDFGSLPANVPMSTMFGIPPPDQQAAVIEQIKAMMASDDPTMRARAQSYMD